jgi:hypothetical protein
MERLTDRNADGNYFYPKCFEKCDGLGASRKCDNCEITTSICEKLGNYEDLEEQGGLIKLPCKVGDTVYAIGFNNNKPIIYESVVLSILITEKEIAFNVKVDEFGINSQLKQSMFDKTVFLAKSAAEAKLKELRGGENG